MNKKTITDGQTDIQQYHESSWPKEYIHQKFLEIQYKKNLSQYPDTKQPCVRNWVNC